MHTVSTAIDHSAGIAHDRMVERQLWLACVFVGAHGFLVLCLHVLFTCFSTHFHHLDDVTQNEWRTAKDYEQQRQTGSERMMKTRERERARARPYLLFNHSFYYFVDLFSVSTDCSVCSVICSGWSRVLPHNSTLAGRPATRVLATCRKYFQSDERFFSRGNKTELQTSIFWIFCVVMMLFVIY